MDLPRRRLLQAAIAVPAALVLPRSWAVQPTPACGAATPPQTAGPFYTPNSPRKANLRADDPAGRPVNLLATVVDTQCRPIPGAIVDLWHANSHGRYDNDGFRLRGHQRADGQGAARFETVMPANYGGRTRHFHVRIFGSRGGTLLTTQLYFPGERGNADDGLFQPELLLDTAAAGGLIEARYRLVIEA